MVFEFDAAKSAANKLKHGIDFVEAQALWLRGVAEAPGRAGNEKRWMVFGIIDGRHWTAVITRRGPKCIRIISVRRSRDNEKEYYEARKANDPRRGI